MKRNPLRVIWLVFLLSALNAFSVQAADVISGIPRITDGDTIVIGTTTIRLQSIEHPRLIRCVSMPRVIAGRAASKHATAWLPTSLAVLLIARLAD